MNKLLLGVLFIVFLGSCGSSSSSEHSALNLNDLYREHRVQGCFLLKSLNSGQLYVYNSDRCEEGFLPASTFKIPNSIIALETGIAADENLVIPWDSIPRKVPSWNQDHTMQTAFQASCVPYYQEIARRIGATRMQEWVHKLQFGRMDIRNENLTNFWLKGKSRITPYGELDFIERLVTDKLPIKPSTTHKIKTIMTIASDSSGMVMRGKTGWAVDGNRNIGWFVGAIERPDGERFVFVNNVEAKVGTIRNEDFMMSRKNIVGKVLGSLGVI